MKIYTKFGDAGNTQILGGIKLLKSDLLIDCIGELDELNSTIGLALSHISSSQFPSSQAIISRLTKVQDEIFQWGAMLAGASPQRHSLPDETSIVRLENEIDEWQAELPQMTHFILPGGSAAGATLHLTRAICRRNERRITSLAQSCSKQQPQAGGLGMLQVYLNRLSDWLFVVARLVNLLSGFEEAKWNVEP